MNGLGRIYSAVRCWHKTRQQQRWKRRPTAANVSVKCILIILKQYENVTMTCEARARAVRLLLLPLHFKNDIDLQSRTERKLRNTGSCSCMLTIFTE